MLLQFVEDLEASSYQRHVISENYHLKRYKREGSGMKTIAIDLQFTQISMGWVQNLSKTTQLFVLNKVMPTIKMYNLLWHYPAPKKTTEKQIIRELTEKQVIFRTEVPGIYLLNPIKLWRGTIFGAIEATRKLLFVHRKPSLAIIIDLKAPLDGGRTNEEEMMLMNSNGITPRLLKIGE